MFGCDPSLERRISLVENTALLTRAQCEIRARGNNIVFTSLWRVSNHWLGDCDTKRDEVKERGFRDEGDGGGERDTELQGYRHVMKYAWD